MLGSPRFLLRERNGRLSAVQAEGKANCRRFPQRSHDFVAIAMAAKLVSTVRALPDWRTRRAPRSHPTTEDWVRFDLEQRESLGDLNQ
jgi:hypothetical protein